MLAEIDALEEARPVVIASDGRVLIDPSADDLLRAARGDRVG
jgi:Na+:H+ antiporter, NhaA family